MTDRANLVKKSILVVFALSATLLLFASIIPGNPLHNVNWALMSALMVGLAVLAFCWRFEKSGATPKEVALTATMASLAAAARIPFAALMSVQPTTFIVMITGYVFGAPTGFMVGAAAALASNLFIGPGPWTPWQMLCWGLCGLSAGLQGKGKKTYAAGPFIILAACWGYLFGWIMNIWHWVGFIYPLTLKTFLAAYAASFAFDTLHAAGNVVFSLLLGQSFYHILHRFKKRLLVTHRTL